MSVDCEGTVGMFMCNSNDVKISYRFPGDNPPPIIIYTLNWHYLKRRVEEYIPNVQSVHGYKYRLFSYTLNTGDHFVTIICTDNVKLKYDGLNPDELECYDNTNGKNHHLSSAFYLLIQ